MEIERKFLLKKRQKYFFSPFSIKKIEKEIEKKGKTINQYYLPLKFISVISKKLKFKIKFKPNELRLREIDEKEYYLTIKSRGSKKREEFERKISRKFFNEYKSKAITSLRKIRLIKPYKKKMLEIDYYPNYKLITAEIEFETKKDAKKFKTKMNDISKDKKYKNRNLAK